MSELRQSLSSPVNAIFVAAEKLLEAVDLHRAGDHAGVAQRIRDADCDAVRAYTEKAWGKGSAARNELLELAYAPAHLAIAERPRPRMPGIVTRKPAKTLLPNVRYYIAASDGDCYCGSFRVRRVLSIESEPAEGQNGPYFNSSLNGVDGMTEPEGNGS